MCILRLVVELMMVERFGAGDFVSVREGSLVSATATPAPIFVPCAMLAPMAITVI